MDVHECCILDGFTLLFSICNNQMQCTTVDSYSWKCLYVSMPLVFYDHVNLTSLGTKLRKRWICKNQMKGATVKLYAWKELYRCVWCLMSMLTWRQFVQNWQIVGVMLVPTVTCPGIETLVPLSLLILRPNYCKRLSETPNQYAD